MAKKKKKKGPIRASKALLKAASKPERLRKAAKNRKPLKVEGVREPGMAGKTFEAAFAKLMKRGASKHEASIIAERAAKEALSKHKKKKATKKKAKKK